MPDVAALLAAQEAAEAEAAALEAAGAPDTTGLVPLLHAVDAARGAIYAVLTGDTARASLLLAEAALAAADAFPAGSREAYALTIVLGAVTEAAGRQP